MRYNYSSEFSLPLQVPEGTDPADYYVSLGLDPNDLVGSHNKKFMDEIATNGSAKVDLYRLSSESGFAIDRFIGTATSCSLIQDSLVLFLDSDNSIGLN